MYFIWNKLEEQGRPLEPYIFLNPVQRKDED